MGMSSTGKKKGRLLKTFLCLKLSTFSILELSLKEQRTKYVKKTGGKVVVGGRDGDKSRETAQDSFGLHISILSILHYYLKRKESRNTLKMSC